MIVAVGLLLLVACTNIASLLVARVLARRRELSVRMALGGSRGRLARLLFTESLIVAIAGAALGLVFAGWSGALLVRQLSTWEGDVSLELALDWRVLGFSVALACASAIVAGVAPALGLRSVAAGEALKDAGRGLAGDRRFAVRGTLVVAQIAVSLMLVTAAGLFLRSFASLNQLPLGFVPEPLLVAELDLQSSDAPIEQRGPRAERLRAAAAAVPGVRSASLSRVSLLTGGGWGANRVADRRWAHACRGSEREPTLAQCHNPGLVRHHGDAARERQRFHRRRSRGRAARRHRQPGVRAPLSAWPAAHRPDRTHWPVER